MSSSRTAFYSGTVFLFLAGFVPFIDPAALCFPSQDVPEAVGRAEGERVHHRLAEYSIQARIPILGDIGHVGFFFIEEEVCRNSDDLEKVFRIFGHSKPELAEKGKDYSGELRLVKWLQPDAEFSSSGYFKKNGVVEGEDIVFYPDHAVSRRKNGDEKRIEGGFGCLVSALCYFLEHEVEAGDVYESAFILGGHPFIFRCEVGAPTIHEPTRARVFPIDFTTFDSLKRDSRGRPKVSKKKGGIRVWLSKEGPYKNIYLRLYIQYKWYLALQMEYLKAR